MVKPKKQLGQHFLHDQGAIQKIADLILQNSPSAILEIGPGAGALTKELLESKNPFYAVEVDEESVLHLKHIYPDWKGLVHADFLKDSLSFLPNQTNLTLCGNFPYNISTQIMFKLLENYNRFEQVIGMFQLEVAQRICADPGSKTYGILSVLIQTFYTTSLELKIAPGAFHPPPKVQSGVIFCQRRDKPILPYEDYPLLKSVVKMAFNQRRKTLFNALQKFKLPKEQWRSHHFAKLRAERLSAQDFAELTRWIKENTHGEL